MNTTISSNGLQNLPLAPGNADSSNASQSSATGAATAGSQASQASDSVKLTDSARALQQAGGVNSQTPVDTARVEQIRKSLAAGNYTVDANKIADRLSSLENQISGK